MPEKAVYDFYNQGIKTFKDLFNSKHYEKLSDNTKKHILYEITNRGTYVDTEKITYSGDYDLSTATNLVVYKNIFQGKIFARELEDLITELHNIRIIANNYNHFSIN